MREQTFSARGHENVSATHASTLEVTTDDWLTPAGDCIVGVEATVAPVDFDNSLKKQAQSPEAQISVRITAGEHRTTITGRGAPDLTFADNRSMVFRTSTYVDDRTVMVDADAAAKDLPRALIAKLQSNVAVDVTYAVER